MSVRGYLSPLTLLAAAGAFAFGALAAAPVVITQQHREFIPGEVEIAAGDVLRFVNQDEFIHHVYVKSDTFNFDSDEQAPGESTDVQFPTSGTFSVGCQIHPKMHLTVTVK